MPHPWLRKAASGDPMAVLLQTLDSDAARGIYMTGNNTMPPIPHWNCMPISRCLPVLLFLLILSGCAGVRVSTIDAEKYMEQRRGDVLTSGKVSGHTKTALQVLGIDSRTCVKDGGPCRDLLAAAQGLDNERKLSALSELWLQEAIEQERRHHAYPAAMRAYLEAARFAYAYLFLSERPMAERTLEERPTQVRDYYNFAAQQSVMLLFRAAKENGGKLPLANGGAHDWSVAFDRKEAPLSTSGEMPSEILPASTLTFDGIRSQYRRDGLGAEMVAVMPEEKADVPWREMRYPALTVILDFPGSTLEHVLGSRDAVIHVYDPFKTERVTLRGASVPLAGNFTSGYGLWLARSSFARQSIGTLVGKGDMLESPRIYLMQPYQPDKKTVIMIHGLASSPEAWINVANEIMGDEALARNYQIWQVYYPTSFPLPVSNFEIRKALDQVISAMDPTKNAAASRDMVVVGHSMGGILARLLVSSSGNKLWDPLAAKRDVGADQKNKARERLHGYLFFEPLPSIKRAVFIAAPHRGTPFADNCLARFAAGLVTLPVKLIKGVIQPAVSLLAPEQMHRSAHSFNGIANLSAHDPFIQAAAALPMASGVPFHSIIGNDTPDVPLESSSDGLVPYASAHLEGAASEKVIASGHSVQETPQGILELRRILHEHLHDQPAGKYAAPAGRMSPGR